MAIVNAITSALPTSKNAKQKLVDDILVIDKADRDSILNDISGRDGYIHADDTDIIFEISRVFY